MLGIRSSLTRVQRVADNTYDRYVVVDRCTLDTWTNGIYTCGAFDSEAIYYTPSGQTASRALEPSVAASQIMERQPRHVTFRRKPSILDFSFPVKSRVAGTACKRGEKKTRN